jgi:hypothetical protein
MVGQLIPPPPLFYRCWIQDPKPGIRIKIRISDSGSTLETNIRIFLYYKLFTQFVCTVTVMCQYTYVDYKICLTLRKSTSYIIVWRETRYCT